MNTKDLIINAVNNAKKIVLRKDGVNYFESTLRQRDPRSTEQAGSCFDILAITDFGQKEQTLENFLFGENIDNWHPYPGCPNLMEGCKAFRLRKDHIGSVGIVDLTDSKRGDVGPDSLVTLVDNKGTGKVSALISTEWSLNDVVDFAVAIVGKENGEDVLFTVHPGDPIDPSVVDCDPGMHGKIVTVREAVAMGIRYAKKGYLSK